MAGRQQLKERTPTRDRQLKWFHEKCKEDPTWNARKQREWRARRPEAFNMTMAKCYIKKLTDEQKRELGIGVKL